MIGQLGDRSHIDRLEPLLNDSSVCQSMQLQGAGRPTTVVQVRDVALVMLLALTDQAPSEYGYLAVPPQPGRKFEIPNLTRESDQQRTEAIAKWRAWRAAHKDDKPAAAVDPSAEKPKEN